MYCGNCGREIKDDKNFCPYCGTPVKNTPQNDEIPASPVQNDAITDIESDHGQKLSVSPLLIILLVLIITLILVIGLFVFAVARKTYKSENEDKSQSNNTEAVESIEEESETFVEDEPSSEPATEKNDATDKQEEVLSEETEQEEELAEYTEDDGIHKYEIIIADVTWREAFKDCIRRGGYLVHFNSEEEFSYVLDLLSSDEYHSKTFYIGGTREIDSNEYFWMNANGDYFGEPLNSSIYNTYWLPGEPSMDSDEGEEFFMDMLFRSSDERWYWNDVPNDVIGISDYYKGRMGYICEYE